jgi:hypothetical protein
MKTRTETTRTPNTTEPKWLEIVREYLAEMRFGSVQIVVHEGRVTQVDATKRTRLNTEPTSP